MTKYKTIGSIKINQIIDESRLDNFLIKIKELQDSNIWNKNDILSLFRMVLPSFNHIEMNKNLDQKM